MNNAVWSYALFFGGSKKVVFKDMIYLGNFFTYNKIFFYNLPTYVGGTDTYINYDKYLYILVIT